MNIKKSLLTIAAALGALSMSAQGAEEVTVYDFQPHWFGQLQIGGQETLGEGSFGKLLSPNAQIAFGRQFSPLFGARISIGAWQSKGTIETDVLGRDTWKFNYVAPSIDAILNLTNALGGYNPERLVDVTAFAGIGVNVGFGNSEANAVQAKYVDKGLPGLQHIWDGTKARLLGRLGAAIDFRLTDQWKIGLELNANFLNDHYNSKKAPNADWYFNALVGVKYCFGKTYTKSTKKIGGEPEVIIQEKIVERLVEVPAAENIEVNESITASPFETFQRDVFFQINSSKISIQEMQKVRDIAEYMKAYPDTKVSITGYADAKTGTLGINVKLAKQRADAVAAALTKNYGIPADRMVVDSMKNQDYQPFPAPDPYELNRVAICIVE